MIILFAPRTKIVTACKRNPTETRQYFSSAHVVASVGEKELQTERERAREKEQERERESGQPEGQTH
eukprot:2031075-Rhodomonas_salina.1